uniref:Uncharacterized protein n=1 Tax=Arundo donax TaxID=35708 RepID=A0A0A9ELQ5_ARUDO
MPCITQQLLFPSQQQ